MSGSGSSGGIELASQVVDVQIDDIALWIGIVAPNAFQELIA